MVISADTKTRTCQSLRAYLKEHHSENRSEISPELAELYRFERWTFFVWSLASVFRSYGTVKRKNISSPWKSVHGLHDDSANDDSAIDKMAARFWHTDDSATFLFEKKGQNFFPTPHGFHLKTFPTPYGCQKGLLLPLTGVFYPWQELIFSLKKLFLAPNWLQIGKNGLNWPSFFYVT